MIKLVDSGFFFRSDLDPGPLNPEFQGKSIIRIWILHGTTMEDLQAAGRGPDHADPGVPTHWGIQPFSKNPSPDLNFII